MPFSADQQNNQTNLLRDIQKKNPTSVRFSCPYLVISFSFFFGGLLADGGRRNGRQVFRCFVFSSMTMHRTQREGNRTKSIYLVHSSNANKRRNEIGKGLRCERYSKCRAGKEV